MLYEYLYIESGSCNKNKENRMGNCNYDKLVPAGKSGRVTQILKRDDASTNSFRFRTHLKTHLNVDKI